MNGDWYSCPASIDGEHGDFYGPTSIVATPGSPSHLEQVLVGYNTVGLGTYHCSKCGAKK